MQRWCTDSKKCVLRLSDCPALLQIYPLWFRAHGVAISTSFNWALNLVVSFTFLYLLQVIFMTCDQYRILCEALRYGTWYLYAGCSATAILLFSFILPETKVDTS